MAFLKAIHINRQMWWTEAQKDAPASSAPLSETPEEPGLQGLVPSPLPSVGKLEAGWEKELRVQWGWKEEERGLTHPQVLFILISSFRSRH